MPRGRPNQGPKLVPIKKTGWREPIYYMRWNENGRSHERSTGTGDRAAAEKIFGQWLATRAEPQRGGPHYPAEAAIADILSRYAESRGPALAAPERIGFAIDRLCDWWGDRRVDAIRPETCRQYRLARRKQGVKEATAAKELSTLRAAVNWAVKNGDLTSAPFVELPPRQPGRDRWLTRAEVARLLWESRRHEKSRTHLPLFVMLAVYTGARREAILSLRWSQVDLVRGQINFNPPGRQQTNKRRPTIPIPRGLRWFLAKAQARASSPHVIAYEGERILRIRRAFAGACRRAGLEGVVPHVLRHTCGCWLAQQGVDLWQIAGWLGHSNERTSELYLHHHPDYLAKARQALERRN
jgi:integrase